MIRLGDIKDENGAKEDRDDNADSNNGNWVYVYDALGELILVSDFWWI